jgi:uncharacterized protein (UPF0264 family)
MRLLVSVRSAAEVAAAVQGGADIVDAKEPSRGSLGAVSPDVLRDIVRVLPPRVPLSIALGDPGEAGEAARATGTALHAVGRRAGRVYLKLGLARAGESCSDVLRSAVGAAADVRTGAQVVLTVYADQARGVSARESALSLAVDAGAHGVLLDTLGKDGRTLFDHVSFESLRAWSELCRRRRLLVALAGSLDAAGIERAAAIAPDVVGVRGAACAGGRGGTVDAERVRRLRDALNRPGAAMQAVADM